MECSKQKVAGGLFWSYGERIVAQMVSLVVSIVLARLLDPENYGCNIYRNDIYYVL